ncbi:unnamed protein product [Bursaphelenchus xylophilus]|nr:unnamed protein product [Bursaphelenchus xylophilus]CAG9092650.1 unnamed protein product [Bursaphelenchus xylophilus]
MKFFVFALFGALLVAQITAKPKQRQLDSVEKRQVRDYFIRLLKDVGINNLDHGTAHLLFLDIALNIIELANSVKLYEPLLPTYNSFLEQLIKAANSKDGTGPELSKVVDLLQAIRNRLSDKIKEPKLIIVDAFLDSAKVLRRDPQHALAVKKAQAINQAAGIEMDDKKVRNFIVNNVIEAYKQGLNISVNPVRAVANVAKAHMAIDLAHPLSTPLRLLINALEAERDLIYPKQNGARNVGFAVLKDQIDLLKKAKAKQDDSVLDGLSGNALALYEEIVEDLKDLKRELRAPPALKN